MLFACHAGKGVFIIWSISFWFSAPCQAALSAASCPSVPICASTQEIVHFFACHAIISNASAFFSSMLDLKSKLLRL